ncbi:site-2 protease family protein [Methanobacterium sp.]|uniref:site-2 protease family protein n=1 Tax=Methanobacterium sp. TaxID=2164 RepID=UPI0031589C1D
MDPYYVIELYAIAFVVIWVLALLFKDKLKIDVSGPLLMRRTTRLRDFIDSIAQKSPRFWRWSMNIGIPIAVFFMFLMLILLAYTLIMAIYGIVIGHGGGAAAAGVGVAIPGLAIPGSSFTVPFTYGLIALVTVIVFHEFAHGILARTEGIKIKSIGLLLLAVLPGAFVEPDEEEVNKASRPAKLRIYAAGSISNLAVAAVAILLMNLLAFSFVGPSFHPQGVEVQNTMPNTPAYGVLQNGMVITHVNGYEATNISTFTDILNTKVKPGEEVNITTNQGTFKLKAMANSNNTNHAYLGVIVQNHLTVNQDVTSKYGDIIPWFLYSLYWLFYWIGFLNLGIGTFNLLPLKPLDGGLMLEELLNYVTSSELANKITKTISIISLALVVGLFSVLFGSLIV